MKILSKLGLGGLRRKYLVNEPFQLRFLAFCGLTALVSCALFYGTAVYFFAKNTSLAIEIGMKPSDPFFRILASMEDMLTWFFAVVSGAIIVFTTIAGLIFSNRVAGPLFRLREHCEKVARGETLEGIQFRGGDYFDDVCHAYNKQMDYLKTRLPAPLVTPLPPNDGEKKAA